VSKPEQLSWVPSWQAIDGQTPTGAHGNESQWRVGREATSGSALHREGPPLRGEPCQVGCRARIGESHDPSRAKEERLAGSRTRQGAPARDAGGAWEGVAISCVEVHEGKLLGIQVEGQQEWVVGGKK
jgi:hypothetical protein